MQDVEDIYALSPMQHGLLFDSVTAESTGMYLIQLEYFLTGEVRLEDFRRAWQETAARHAILRTSFHWDEMEKPLQVVHKAVELPLAFEDWSALDEGERDARIEAFRTADREGGCEFEAAPLTRLALFKIGPDRYRLLWSFHHILMEGWSASLILKEVLQRYQAGRSGAPLELAEHRPYRDYVGWFQEQDPKRAEEFWRNELAGFQDPTRLGIDRSLTSLHAPVTEFDSFAIDLTEDETSALSAFAQKHGVTLNTIVQGAWAVLLSTYAGEEDVVFGAIVSGRSVPLDGVDTMIGLFVNLMPVRAQVSRDDALLPWLKGLQVRQVKQREFEYCSLVEVKSWSEVPPGMSLFETLLVFENWSGDLTVSDWDTDLAVSDVHGHHGAPGYPMTIIVAPGPKMMIGVSWDRTRFDRASVERLVENFRVLLLGMLDAADRAIGELPLLSKDERERMLVEWNRTEDASVPFATVIEGFERQAAATPDAVAVEHAGARTTYGELDARANRLANWLLANGVAEGARVALCTERTLDMVVGMLGIQKAGCSYVPLDPKHPKDRLEFLLTDAKVAALVTQEELEEKLPEVEGLRRVLINRDWSEIETASNERPPVSPSPDRPVYMIYTSGSTGKPKGVVIRHASLANYVAHALDVFGMQPSDRMLQFASISFDTAAEETYPTLLAGATLVLRDDDMIGSVETFLETCREWGITIIDFPTAYWHVVVEGLDDSGAKVPDGVRLVILGGERAKPEQLADWWRHVGEDGPRLLNTYGPTEATIVATVAELRASDPPTRIVPIGKPVRNARVYVLDPRGEPVPIGVPGELHIGGAGLAEGYFERPDLTAERFVPDPFAGGDARMYRTGDLVRYRSDGNLEFVGRRDSQVKFRGYRIELEEIEATLSQHERVHEAVVVLREDQPGKQRLVGYVVARGSEAPGEGELREELGEVLPAYMVPSAIVFLEKLPLTPHGKVDHRALPEPAASSVERDSGFVEPRTDLERTIAGIWAEVLDLDRVGANDNFFDLGGHSLLLMTVIADLKKQVGVRVTPGELVLPTVGQLAKLCEERLANPGKEKKGGGLMKKLASWFDRS